jgi:hypothetical protein
MAYAKNIPARHVIIFEKAALSEGALYRSQDKNAAGLTS